jgi:hypothetical protein
MAERFRKLRRVIYVHIKRLPPRGTRVTVRGHIACAEKWRSVPAVSSQPRIVPSINRAYRVRRYEDGSAEGRARTRQRAVGLGPPEVLVHRGSRVKEVRLLVTLEILIRDSPGRQRTCASCATGRGHAVRSDPKNYPPKEHSRDDNCSCRNDYAGEGGSVPMTSQVPSSKTR